MNKELLKSYKEAIEEELEMMKGKSISTQVLDYIDKLMHTYKELEEMCNEEVYVKSFGDFDETEVDENVEDAIMKYVLYVKHRETYENSGKQQDLDMAHKELEEFLDAVVRASEEVEEASRDCMEDRMMIKSKIKSIYQMFN